MATIYRSLLALSAKGLAVALTFASVASARDLDVPRPANPYVDPQDDPYNPLGYITTNSLSAMGVGELMCFWFGADPALLAISRRLYHHPEASVELRGGRDCIGMAIVTLISPHAPAVGCLGVEGFALNS